MARLAYSLETLRAEINAQFPNRDRSTDGWIDDPSHAASNSDHNPNTQGVVCALDVDTDLDGTNNSSDPQMFKMLDWFRLHPVVDLKYVIYNRQIFSHYSIAGIPAYTWRPYTKDPHTTHAHISVGRGPDGKSAPPYDGRLPWGVADAFGAPPQLPPPPPEVPEDIMVRLQRPSNDTTVYVVSEAATKVAVPDPAWLKDYANRFGKQILTPSVGGPCTALEVINGVAVEICNPDFLAAIPKV